MDYYFSLKCPCISWFVLPSCLLKELRVARGLGAVPSVLGGARQEVRNETLGEKKHIFSRF